MNRFNLDRELKHMKNTDISVPPLVRTRLDDTYAAILDQTAAPTATQQRSRLRRYLSVPAACAVLGIALFSSGFVSPIMASSIKSVPLIGSLFSAIESDIGLRHAGEAGLASQVNNQISYNDVTFKVQESVFDGSRAAFVVQVTAPNLQQGLYDNGKEKVKLSNAIDNAWFHLKGHPQGDDSSQMDGLFYGGAGEDYPDTLVFEQVLPSSTTLPDAFEAEVTLTLQGMDHEFKLDVPFKRTANSLIELSATARASNDELSTSIDNIRLTPVTATLDTSVLLNGASNLTEREESRLRHIGFALFDDQGRRMPVLHGEGVYEDNRLDREYRYAATTGSPAYVVVKPFMIEDDFAEEPKEEQYIKALEMKIDLPQPTVRDKE